MAPALVRFEEQLRRSVEQHSGEDQGEAYRVHGFLTITRAVARDDPNRERMRLEKAGKVVHVEHGERIAIGLQARANAAASAEFPGSQAIDWASSSL